MPIFNDCYSTTIGSAFVTKPIIAALKTAIIKDDLYNNTLDVSPINDFYPIFLIGNRYSESDIPVFNHPIEILNFNQKNYICSDLRLYVRESNDSNNLDVKNTTEFNFAKSRAVLNLLWASGAVDRLRLNLEYSEVIFCAWLSEVISKNYALDYKDQIILSIITSYYYQMLFIKENTVTESVLQSMAIHTIKTTKAPADLVFSVFDRIKPINGIKEYCSNVASILENVRVEKFNLVMLLTIIKNSWYGTNAKDIISVAIEHPPTWCAILYTALTEKTYRNCIITRIAERFNKKGEMKNYILGYSSLVKEYTISEESIDDIYIQPFE